MKPIVDVCCICLRFDVKYYPLNESIRPPSDLPFEDCVEFHGVLQKILNLEGGAKRLSRVICQRCHEEFRRIYFFMHRCAESERILSQIKEVNIRIKKLKMISVVINMNEETDGFFDDEDANSMADDIWHDDSTSDCVSVFEITEEKNNSNVKNKIALIAPKTETHLDRVEVGEITNIAAIQQLMGLAEHVKSEPQAEEPKLLFSSATTSRVKKIRQYNTRKRNMPIIAGSILTAPSTTADDRSPFTYDDVSQPILSPGSRYDYSDISTAPSSEPKRGRGRPMKTPGTQPSPKILKKLSPSERKYVLYRFKNTEASRVSRQRRVLKQQRQLEEERQLTGYKINLQQSLCRWERKVELLKTMLMQMGLNDSILSPSSRYDYSDIPSADPTSEPKRGRGRPMKTPGSQPSSKTLKQLSPSERKYVLHRFKNTDASPLSRPNRVLKQQQLDEERQLTGYKINLQQSLCRWERKVELLKAMLTQMVLE